MTPIQQMFLGAAAPVDKIYIEDVFQSNVYNGYEASRRIADNLDIEGEGGLFWIKCRSDTAHHWWADSERGILKRLQLSANYAQSDETGRFTYPESGKGVLLGQDGDINYSGREFLAQSFRRSKGFLDIVTWTGNATTRNISHGLDSVPGAIVIKALGSTGDWVVYHKDKGNESFGKLNTIDDFWTSNDIWDSTTPTSTTFRINGNNSFVNANNIEYVAYVFASEDQRFGADGDEAVIHCGSYTGNGSDSTDIDVNIGWQPQFLIVKQTADDGNWQLVNAMLPWPGFTGGLSEDWTTLRPNSDVAEVSDTDSGIYKTPTGFKIVKDYGNFNTNNDTHVFIAIRGADIGVGKSIEDLGGASKVFAIDKGSDSTTIPNFDADFPVEMGLIKKYDANSNDWYLADRQGGSIYNKPNSNVVAAAESDYTFDCNKGWSKKQQDNSHICYMWKKAPGFFTTSHFIGNGSTLTIPHDLGAVPEMIWVKNQETASKNWRVYHAGSHGATNPQNDAWRLNDQNDHDESTNYWQNTTPTSTNFYVGADDEVNESGKFMAAYLFASVAGVSKVGYYTGTGWKSGSYHGGTQTIVTGFVPRFILIKWDGNGAWYIFDAERGLTSSGTNKYLYLNYNYAEIEPDDQWIYQVSDGANSGFWLNGAVTGNDINEGLQKYIYYAVA